MTAINNDNDHPTFDGDADEVGRELLAWAGLLDLWDGNALGDDYHPFFDVGRDCEGLEIDDRIVGDDRPMMTEIVYTVEVIDADGVKKEMAEQVSRLVAEKRRRTRGPGTSRITLTLLRAASLEPSPGVDFFVRGFDTLWTIEAFSQRARAYALADLQFKDTGSYILWTSDYSPVTAAARWLYDQGWVVEERGGKIHDKSTEGNNEPPPKPLIELTWTKVPRRDDGTDVIRHRISGIEIETALLGDEKDD